MKFKIKKAMMSIVLITVFGFIGVVYAFCDEEYKEINYSEIKKVDSYKVGTKIITKTAFNIKYGLTELVLPNPPKFYYLPTSNDKLYLIFSEVDFPFLRSRLENNKEYSIYFTVKKISGSKSKHFVIDKIEGIKSIEVYEAEQKAAAEAKLAERWAPRNPNNLDRTQYKRMTRSDFTFEMSAGTLPVGSKIQFEAFFLSRPTGTSYKFKNIAIGINFTSRHNFAGRLSTEHFQETVVATSRFEQWPVQVFVTVIKSGEFGECSVDIMNWPDELRESLTGSWR